MIVEARNLPEDVLVMSELKDGTLHIYYRESEEDSPETWRAIGQLVHHRKMRLMERLMGEVF